MACSSGLKDGSILLRPAIDNEVFQICKEKSRTLSTESKATIHTKMFKCQRFDRDKEMIVIMYVQRACGQQKGNANLTFWFIWPIYFRTPPLSVPGRVKLASSAPRNSRAVAAWEARNPCLSQCSGSVEEALSNSSCTLHKHKILLITEALLLDDLSIGALTIIYIGFLQYFIHQFSRFTVLKTGMLRF